VPELHFDAAVGSTTLFGVVGRDRRARTAAIADDHLVRQLQRFFQLQRDAMRASLRQCQVIAIDALVTLGERHVVRVADQLDHDVLLVLQILERLLDVRDERLRYFRRLGVQQRLHQIADARAMRLPFLEAHLTNGLHAADLDALDVLPDQHFLIRERSLRLVVPHLHLDATVQRASFRCRVGRDRLLRAGPLVRNRLGRQRQTRLQELGNFARTLARQAFVVAVGARERVGQPLIIRVADEMQPHVASVAQIIERLAHQLDVVLRNIGDARREANRRQDIRELHGRQAFRMHRTHLDAIARILLQQARIVCPRTQRLIRRQIALDRLAA